MLDHSGFVAELKNLGAAMVPEVLETMFFASVAETDDARCADDSLNVRLQFRGCPSGTFALTVDRPVARELASAFLGRDISELGDAEDVQVACELANMLCGSVLSRAESDTGFELDSPETTEAGEIPQTPDYQASFLLDVGGAIEVRFGLAGESR